MILVLDASVIAKWFKNEDNSDLALGIRDDFWKGLHEIIVPDLILYEISNALRFDSKFSSELIKKSIQSLFDMEITITVPSENLISNAVEIAVDKKITVYDAIYVALSLQTSAVFITADKELYEKVKILKNCKLLSKDIITKI